MNARKNTAGPLSGINRRHFLRGLGASLALPALESFPARLFAGAAAARPLATTASGAPLRTAFIYFPNGAIPGSWWPEAEGTDFKMNRTLEPLAPFQKSLQILGGLDHRTAEGHSDGGGDHARANGTFLTGVRLKKSASDIHAGISIDQTIARQIGHLTRFPSLELTCDSIHKSGACDSGYSCAYQFNISWSSPTTPMTPEANPRLAFERLFGTGAPGKRVENFKRRQKEQRSILDFVLEDARDLRKDLTARDRDKVDEYLDGVRQIEKRIESSERSLTIKDPNVPAPDGIPPQYSEYIQTMFDLLVLAFQTDSTRVATLLLAHDGSNRSFSEIGISEGHHDLSHHFENEEKIQKLKEIDLWYVQQLAHFFKKMEGVKDLDGKSLLHNSMIVYGGGNADGNRHTHTNLPIVLAGNGGGSLMAGRYHRYASEPMTNLFLSMTDCLGIKPLERFGDSTRRLDTI
jgi:hypothetical protein